ncbi:unnamed protein product [Lampetra fluviatilis]
MEDAMHERDHEVGGALHAVSAPSSLRGSLNAGAVEQSRASRSGSPQATEIFSKFLEAERDDFDHSAEPRTAAVRFPETGRGAETTRAAGLGTRCEAPL